MHNNPVAGCWAGAAMSWAGAVMRRVGAVIILGRGTLNYKLSYPYNAQKCKKKAKCDGPTDRPTDRRTDTVAYRSRVRDKNWRE